MNGENVPRSHIAGHPPVPVLRFLARVYAERLFGLKLAGADFRPAQLGADGRGLRRPHGRGSRPFRFPRSSLQSHERW